MKYLDEFRDPVLARKLVARIRSLATSRWVLMDVCGGQTHSLLRHGIEDALADSVELIHGPGCPVCVTPIELIDAACQLARYPNVTVTSFGDMIRVPGSDGSLLSTQSAGGSVATVYSPMDAVAMAAEDPSRQFVFFAVGFETTAPATALAVLQADRMKLNNFSLLVSHVCVLPAMEAMLLQADNRVEGFLAAGHVCTITGFDEYEPLVRRFGVPVVVTGFEPLDLLCGIEEAVSQLESGQATVANQYARSVRRHGNTAAMNAMGQVYKASDRRWRGLGLVPRGGLQLQSQFRHFDAEQKFPALRTLPVLDDSDCRSGDVLAGRIKPPECSHFMKRCCPETPLGAPMVSSEGACAAYYHYQRDRDETLASETSGP